MISFIIWLLGVVLTIKAALDIWKLQGDDVKKILFIVLIVLTSWVGIIVYFLFKNKFPEWVK
ncbi:MAG: PLDc N-terminal domain-containing protein [Candidatus Cryptobacteroides sp.]